MKTNRHRPLGQALRQAAPLPEPRPAAEFWQDFRARSALTLQEAPDRVAVVGVRLTSLRWVVATAAVLVLLASVSVFLRTGPVPPQVAQAPTATATTTTDLSTVQELEVFSEYSSVMIIEDAENGGTVIWVASADTGRLR